MTPVSNNFLSQIYFPAIPLCTVQTYVKRRTAAQIGGHYYAGDARTRRTTVINILTQSNTYHGMSLHLNKITAKKNDAYDQGFVHVC